MVVVWPSLPATRTSTSVIVACRPTKSIRRPARPPGASMTRRSRIEPGRSWVPGPLTVRTSSGKVSTTGSGMPERSGVRQMTA